MAGGRLEAHSQPVPVYRFYQLSSRPKPHDAAALPNDEAALMYAYGFLDWGVGVDVWEETRHVAQLWGELASGTWGETAPLIDDARYRVVTRVD